MRSKTGLMFRLVPVVAVGSLLTLAACGDEPPPPTTTTHSTYSRTTTMNAGPTDPVSGMPMSAPATTTTRTTTYNTQNSNQ
jgi:hypothetical protein